MASRIALVLIMSMVFAGPAAAGDWGRSGWYAGAGGGVGWDFLEEAIEDGVNKKCGDNCIDVGSGGTFNLRGGYRVTSWFAVEGMYEGVYGVSAKTAKDLSLRRVLSPPITIPKRCDSSPTSICTTSSSMRSSSLQSSESSPTSSSALALSTTPPNCSLIFLGDLGDDHPHRLRSATGRRARPLYSRRAGCSTPRSGYPSRSGATKTFPAQPRTTSH